MLYTLEAPLNPTRAWDRTTLPTASSANLASPEVFAFAQGSRTEVLIPPIDHYLDFVEPPERVGLSRLRRALRIWLRPEGCAFAPGSRTEVLIPPRRGWDSNPRWAQGPQRFSRPPHSTTLPPLQKYCQFPAAPSGLQVAALFSQR